MHRRFLVVLTSLVLGAALSVAPGVRAEEADWQAPLLRSDVSRSAPRVIVAPVLRAPGAAFTTPAGPGTSGRSSRISSSGSMPVAVMLAVMIAVTGVVSIGLGVNDLVRPVSRDDNAGHVVSEGAAWLTGGTCELLLGGGLTAAFVTRR